MIRKKVKHIYFKSFIDNADIINTHNYFTSYSEFFNKENFKEEAKYYNGFYLLFRNNFYLCDEYKFSKYTKRLTCISNKNE